MVAVHVPFFTGHFEDDGTWCEYRWTYPYTDGDDDCSDGYKSKAFKNTAVHELGHGLGLGHSSYTSSAVSNYCDVAAGCSFDSIDEVDATVLQEVYDQCLP